MPRKYFLMLAIVGLYSGIAKGGPTLIITEVFYDTPGIDSEEEWIELFNPTASAINLEGFSLQDNGSTFTIGAGNVVGAFQTFILARDAMGFAKLNPGVTPDLTTFPLALSNAGDFLRLRDNLGILLDEVAWEGGLPGWENVAATTGNSITRGQIGAGPNAWLANQTPAPGTPAPIPEPSTLVLMAGGLWVLRRRRKWNSRCRKFWTG